MNIDIETIQLARGAHESPDEGMCVMELAAYLAHEPHSDHPVCVSRIIGAFLRSWNDSLDDATRQRLKPYAAKALNTAASKKIEDARAWLATDWLCRVYLPAWALDAAGTVALDAAGTAAGSAAWTVALDAAGTAAGAAAWDAALDAARTAWDARAAAGDAAESKLVPAVAVLHESAFDLLDRLIACKGELDERQ